MALQRTLILGPPLLAVAAAYRKDNMELPHLHEPFSYSTQDIHRQGYSILTEILTSTEVKEFKSSDTYRDKFNQAGLRKYHSPTKGRYHRLEFDSHFLYLINDLQDRLRPFAEEYLNEGRLGCRQQILFSSPKSVHQFWHRDNAIPGITFLVPLCNIDDPNIGPTELIPGSHKSSWRGCKILLGCPLQSGDALAFDSRTLHRGQGNNSPFERPVLAFEFYSENQPPPNQGVFATQWDKIHGHWLSVFATFGFT